jgi:exodeoxyribonuclease V gamma subunit
MYPSRPYEAVTIGRSQRDSVTVARIRLPDQPKERRAVALRELLMLVDLFDRGRREPLPLYCKTSAAYAAAVAAGKDGRAAAKKEWERDWKFPKEADEPEHRLVLGGTPTVAQLFEEPPRADESGDGWAADEPSRAGRYARRLWDGLRANEEVIDR